MSIQYFTKKTRWVFFMIFAPLLTLIVSLAIRLLFGTFSSIFASDFLAATIAMSITAITSLGSLSSLKRKKERNEDRKAVLFCMFAFAIFSLIVYIIVLLSEITNLPQTPWVRHVLQWGGFVLACANGIYCVKNTYKFEVILGEKQ